MIILPNKEQNRHSFEKFIQNKSQNPCSTKNLTTRLVYLNYVQYVLYRQIVFIICTPSELQKSYIMITVFTKGSFKYLYILQLLYVHKYFYNYILVFFSRECRHASFYEAIYIYICVNFLCISKHFEFMKCLNME